MQPFLILRFEAPLQAWGKEAVDPRRPSSDHPRLSALAGLTANALGWRHRDADRITELQDALRYAVREDRPPEPLWDYQTADLSRLSGWGRWGPTKPGGGFAGGTHILRKEYLADGLFTVALGLRGSFEAVSLDAIEAALSRPARPLFLGRKSCPPAAPVLRTRVEAPTPLDALHQVPLDPSAEEGESYRFWFEEGSELPDGAITTREVWDRRNYRTTRFDRSRRIVEARFPIEEAP